MFFKKKLLISSAILIAVAVLLRVGGARLPDRTLHFERQAESKELPESIGAMINSVEDWPKGHHQLHRSTLIRDAAHPQLAAGSRIEWILKPKEWKSIQWDIEVLEHDPGRFIRLKLVKDHSGKSEKLLQDIEWSIERRSGEMDGVSIIVGKASARTFNAKGRWLGLIAERLIMHQIFYADLNRIHFDLSATQHHPAFDPPADSR